MIYKFKSDIAQILRDYTAFLEGSSFSRQYIQTQQTHLKKLDMHCIQVNHSTGYLDCNLIDSFTELSHNKGHEYIQERSTLRVLAYYTISKGNKADIPSFSITQSKNTAKEFCSCLGSWMKRLIAFKQASGYKYYNEIKFLHQFDMFLVENNFEGDSLTQEMVDLYSRRPHSESTKTISNKLGVVNVLSQFMNRNEGQAVPVEINVKVHSKVPEYFSIDDLKCFFIGLADHQYRYPWSYIMWFMYFRLLLTTGMREGECTRIEIKNIDFTHNRFLLTDTKNDKERYVYFTPADSSLLNSYLLKIKQYQQNPKWLFPKIPANKHISEAEARTMFDYFRKKLNLKKHLSVHSFRHTYTIMKIKDIEEDGHDANSKLKLLSAQLGHSSLAETYDYCKRLDSRFIEILNKPSPLDHITIYQEVLNEN